MSRHPIVLYNSSIFLLGIEAILRQNPMLEIVCLGEETTDPSAQLLALEPALIIFDRLVTDAATLLPLLLKQPTLALVGVDADSSQVWVLAGERSVVNDGQGLAQLISAHLAPPGAVT